MNLHPIDLMLIASYLLFVAIIGFWVKKKATKELDSYFLADRNVPWWLLGLSGCSSYIDIGGTMAMVGALYYLGLKAIWATHIYWGWFIICFYMAFQAKWIRRSGVMTFAEWNQTRFGDNRDAEMARIAAALFLLVLMIFNLIYIAVGIGKFAKEFLPFSRLGSTLVVFTIVGLYVTLAGFFGVILTDMLQTVLIAVGAVILSIMVFQNDSFSTILSNQDPSWSSLALSWNLWDGYLQSTPESYHHFYLFGPVLLAGFSWLIFRVLAGPNVWDFQFFLTARSPRDAALAGGMWTVGYTLRWILGCAFLILGIIYLGAEAGFDAEKIMPLVLTNLPVGIRGLFMAVLLAALMSTLDAMINVTSSVVVNDFLKRYFFKKLSQKALVRLGQLASVLALFLGFIFSMMFQDIISAWETMIFVVVTMILVPATFRWHWWRFSAKAFVWGMVASASLIILQKIFFGYWSAPTTLAVDTLACFVATLIIGFILKPTEMNILVDFYSRIRPFGVWGPVRREAVRRVLVPANDKMPAIDVLNGFLTMIFQFSLALVPFYFFLQKKTQALAWSAVIILLGIVLYFTWYKNLPARHEN
ncbi:MAG: Na+:solute symporter [Calditrichia bacterium]